MCLCYYHLHVIVEGGGVLRSRTETMVAARMGVVAAMHHQHTWRRSRTESRETVFQQ
jgi:hypothetical protein